MTFDASPEAMEEGGLIWFPSDANRIRWWTKEGQSVVVRPSVPADTGADTYGTDVLWACVGRLEREQSDRLFAEWIVSRPDLGLSIIASKLEVVLKEYYRRLVDTSIDGKPSLSEILGAEAARGIVDQFSSASPKYCILSGTDKAPIVEDIDGIVVEAADRCENVQPMKRIIYTRVPPQ